MEVEFTHSLYISERIQLHLVDLYPWDRDAHLLLCTSLSKLLEHQITSVCHVPQFSIPQPLSILGGSPTL